MKARTIKNLVILFLLFVYMVLYKLFIFQKYVDLSEFVSVSFLVTVLTLSIILLGFRKDKKTILGKNILKVVVFYVLLAFFVMYGMGFIVGFLKNVYPRSILSIVGNIFVPSLIIILVEFIRYVFISANKDKKIMVVILTIVLILFEVFTTINSFSLSDLVAVYNIMAIIILPCIFRNILLSYLTYHVGYRIPIIYRLIMEVYIFIVPIVPNLGDYVNSMVLISLPILIYITASGTVNDNQNKSVPIFNVKRFTIWDIPIAIVLVTLVALVSGFFPHYMIGIGSNSMQPAISKGDAVILQKINIKTKLKKGDIIAYNNGKIIVVHRINKVVGTGKKVSYIMKGDANNGVDPKPISRSEIQGIVRIKIPYIAWPTVWLSELFNN